MTKQLETAGGVTKTKNKPTTRCLAFFFGLLGFINTATIAFVAIASKFDSQSATDVGKNFTSAYALSRATVDDCQSSQASDSVKQLCAMYQVGCMESAWRNYAPDNSQVQSDIDNLVNRNVSDYNAYLTQFLKFTQGSNGASFWNYYVNIINGDPTDTVTDMTSGLCKVNKIYQSASPSQTANSYALAANFLVAFAVISFVIEMFLAIRVWRRGSTSWGPTTWNLFVYCIVNLPTLVVYGLIFAWGSQISCWRCIRNCSECIGSPMSTDSLAFAIALPIGLVGQVLVALRFVTSHLRLRIHPVESWEYMTSPLYVFAFLFPFAWLMFGYALPNMALPIPASNWIVLGVSIVLTLLVAAFGLNMVRIRNIAFKAKRKAEQEAELQRRREAIIAKAREEAMRKAEEERKRKEEEAAAAGQAGADDYYDEEYDEEEGDEQGEEQEFDEEEEEEDYVENDMDYQQSKNLSKGATQNRNSTINTGKSAGNRRGSVSVDIEQEITDDDDQSRRGTRKSRGNTGKRTTSRRGGEEYNSASDSEFDGTQHREKHGSMARGTHRSSKKRDDSIEMRDVRTSSMRRGSYDTYDRNRGTVTSRGETDYTQDDQYTDDGRRGSVRRGSRGYDEETTYTDDRSSYRGEESRRGDTYDSRRGGDDNESYYDDRTATMASERTDASDRVRGPWNGGKSDRRGTARSYAKTDTIDSLSSYQSSRY